LGLLANLDPTSGTLVDAQSPVSLITGFVNAFEAWFGTTSTASTPSAAAAQVTTTVTAIRAAVAGGYTLQTFTASNSAWTVDPALAAATEAYAGVVGGGGMGDSGQYYANSTTGGTALGGVGGASGGFLSAKFDPTTLGATLNITIG